jgi:hypothetical protein
VSETYPFARFWRCALQVNPAGYHTTYRGSNHGMSEASYNLALLEECRKLDVRVVGVRPSRLSCEQLIPAIRDSVATILEGSRDAFIQRNAQIRVLTRMLKQTRRRHAQE